MGAKKNRRGSDAEKGAFSLRTHGTGRSLLNYVDTVDYIRHTYIFGSSATLTVNTRNKALVVMVTVLIEFLGLRLWSTVLFGGGADVQ